MVNERRATKGKPGFKAFGHGRPFNDNVNINKGALGMDLKNAVAVCLISLFSATLVVLVARSLDSQAALRLEPQLAAIAEELRALRGQGGIAVGAAAPTDAETIDDGLVVYYLHGNTRCPTCRSIEAQAKESVQTHFAPQMNEGKIIWKTLNYEQDAAARPLALRFEVQMPVVVVAKMRDGEIEDWRRLDQVWALVDDKPGFAELIRTEVSAMLESKPETTMAAESDSVRSPPSALQVTPNDDAPPALPLP